MGEREGGDMVEGGREEEDEWVGEERVWSVESGGRQRS